MAIIIKIIYVVMNEMMKIVCNNNNKAMIMWKAKECVNNNNILIK